MVVRWFLLVTWLTLINIRTHEPNLPYLNAMGLALVAVNGHVQWRIWRLRPITWPYVLALSLMDLTVITAGNMVSSILGKLGLRSRPELVRWAFEHQVTRGEG